MQTAHRTCTLSKYKYILNCVEFVHITRFFYTQIWFFLSKGLVAEENNLQTLFTPRYSWNTAEVGVKHQLIKSINWAETYQNWQAYNVAPIHRTFTLQVVSPLVCECDCSHSIVCIHVFNIHLTLMICEFQLILLSYFTVKTRGGSRISS